MSEDLNKAKIALLIIGLQEALDEWSYASSYKGDYLTWKHADAKRIEELRPLTKGDDSIVEQLKLVLEKIKIIESLPIEPEHLHGMLVEDLLASDLLNIFFAKEPGLSLSQLANLAVEETEKLKKAIRKHRDAKGDDRCWMDDEELYEVLGEPIPPRPLPPEDEMLKNCERFIALRKRPGEATASGPQGRWVTAEELAAWGKT